VLELACRLQAPNDPTGEDGRSPAQFGEPMRERKREELPYKVEVWDVTGAFVEHVVALSTNPAVGFAAYYAAAREYPGRDITLRHRDSTLSRWTARPH
jgi:hypothetical protein